MDRTLVNEWAQGLIEGDKRVDWQKSEMVLPSDISRIVHIENPDITDEELQAICDIINEYNGEK